MPNHMFLMSFDGSLIRLFNSLNRFFEYIVAMLQKNRDIKFCYIGTAANDKWIENFFFSKFMRIKFGNQITISRLVLTKDINEQQIEDCLSAQDILFVGGGNTERMLKIWENKGFIKVLNKLKNENRLPILAGVSAGGMYPFHSGLSDSTEGQYKPLSCLGWLKQSFCPHANSKKEKRCAYNENKQLHRFSAFQSAIKLGQLPEGFAVPDNCMLHFYNDNLIRALTSHPDNNCFYVTADTSQPIETVHLTKRNLPNNASKILSYLGFEENSVQTEVRQSILWMKIKHFFRLMTEKFSLLKGLLFYPLRHP